MSKPPVILWFRRDLRLMDHPALSAAVASGRPVIPLFIHDSTVEALGAAPKWRMSLSLQSLSEKLAEMGSRLTLQRGPALEVLRALVAETGAGAVYWSRLYDPDAVARDTAVKAALKKSGVEAKSFGGHLLFEPWTVATQTGGYYRVFSPFWKAVRNREVPTVLAAPPRLAAPPAWPGTDTLPDWRMDRSMHRGARVVRAYARPGEAAAQDRLGQFVDQIIAGYAQTRDIPAENGTSGLSEHLALGEISPHMCWHTAQVAREEGKAGAEPFLRQLAWREFAYHLMHHTPHILSGNWKPDWDSFPWNTDADHPWVQAWQRGRTGIPFVDAAMREMYITGRMHNRGRMIVASYLTKHLMCHWRIGQAWFDDCLIDWDPACNAMGWQWAAGSGPDAAPYFRVFNPLTQLEKFDPEHRYVRRWIAEGQTSPTQTALSYFDAVPKHWTLDPTAHYPDPIVTAEAGRKRALTAYEARKF